MTSGRDLDPGSWPRAKMTGDQQPATPWWKGDETGSSKGP